MIGLTSGRFEVERPPLFVIRQAKFVERNFIPKRVGEDGVALGLGCLPCPSSSLGRLGKSAGLRISSRKSAQIIGILAAGKLYGLFGKLDCPVPIAN